MSGYCWMDADIVHFTLFSAGFCWVALYTVRLCSDSPLSYLALVLSLCNLLFSFFGVWQQQPVIWIWFSFTTKLMPFGGLYSIPLTSWTLSTLAVGPGGVSSPIRALVVWGPLLSSGSLCTRVLPSGTFTELSPNPQRASLQISRVLLVQLCRQWGSAL